MKSKRHWMVLSEALRRREAPTGSRSVVRRFQSLGVFDVSSGAHDADGQWMTYRVPGCPGGGLQIRHVKRRLSASDLVGFNNTGNVCVWPSEEVLTVVCVARRDMFRDKLVVEVGGGMTCLAGVTVAANMSARRVLLTDGNETAVQNVQYICDRNRPLFGSTTVEASRLRWTEPADVASLQEQCDVILSADCLFFDDARDSLADFIVAVLKPGGVALVVAPPRSGTLDRFEQEALRCGLLVSRLEEYGPYLDSLIQSHRSDPTFDPNLHLPVLLELTKPPPHADR